MSKKKKKTPLRYLSLIESECSLRQQHIVFPSFNKKRNTEQGTHNKLKSTFNPFQKLMLTALDGKVVKDVIQGKRGMFFASNKKNTISTAELDKNQWKYIYLYKGAKD